MVTVQGGQGCHQGAEIGCIGPVDFYHMPSDKLLPLLELHDCIILGLEKTTD